jgi:hypothetical protein
MNRFVCPSLLLVLISTVAFAQDESKEPPQSFVVKLGDQSLTVVEGEATKLAGSFTNPQVTITPEPYRVFPYQGLRFQYPRTFSFEADLADPAEKSWTLSGNDVKIMFFSLDAKLTPTAFADSVLEQFDRSKSKVLDPNAKLTLGAHAVTGVKLQLTVATHKMTQEAYAIPTLRGKTRLLVLQDNPDERGNHSAEGKAMLALLQKTFQVDGK